MDNPIITIPNLIIGISNFVELQQFLPTILFCFVYVFSMIN